MGHSLVGVKDEGAASVIAVLNTRRADGIVGESKVSAVQDGRCGIADLL
ncbi:MAG: hypothetical protein J6I37_05455 [Prevotella sp.]|nr:hypothetical protein [Prevotella sp.]